MYRNTPILYRILEAFFRYRLLFLACTVIVTVLPGAYLMTRKASYTSTASIQVVLEDVSAALGDTKINGSWVTIAQQNVNRFNDWMSDDSAGGFVDIALQQAHLAHPISVDPRSRDPRLALLRKGLSLTPVSDTVFAINLVWDNSAECEQIVKSLEAEYIERTGQDKQAQSVAVVKFLDGELEKYAGRLRVAENAVTDFKRINAGQSAEAQSAAMDQLSSMKIQLNDLEVSAHNNDLKREFFHKRIAEIKPTSILEQHITDSPLQIQKNQLETKRNTLLAEGWLATSARVQALDTQIQRLKLDIDAEIKTNPGHTNNVTETIVQANPEYRELQSQLNEAVISGNTEQAQMQHLRQRITEYEARIARLPAAEAQLNDRMRDFNVLKTEYEDLLKRREQARLKTSLDRVAATSTLHGIGTIYAQPTGSKSKTVITLAGLLVFGLLLGLGVTVLAEWADPSVRFASDVQRRLGVPILISLPELEPSQRIGPASGPELLEGGPSASSRG